MSAAQLLSVVKRLESLSKRVPGPDSNDANDLASRLEEAVSALVPEDNTTRLAHVVGRVERLAGCSGSGSDHVARLEYATAQLSGDSAAIAASSSSAAADAKAAQEQAAQDEAAKKVQEAQDQQAKAAQEAHETERKAQEQAQAKAVAAEKAAAAAKDTTKPAGSPSASTSTRSVGKGTSSPASGDMAAAYEAVRNDSSPEEWALYGYSGNDIVVKGTGRGLDAFLERLEDSERNYGYLRCLSTDSNPMVKFALVTWIGQGVSPLKKAKVSTDKARVKQVVAQYAFELLISDKSDLVDGLKERKLLLGK